MTSTDSGFLYHVKRWLAGSWIVLVGGKKNPGQTRWPAINLQAGTPLTWSSRTFSWCGRMVQTVGRGWGRWAIAFSWNKTKKTGAVNGSSRIVKKKKNGAIVGGGGWLSREGAWSYKSSSGTTAPSAVSFMSVGRSRLSAATKNRSGQSWLAVRMTRRRRRRTGKNERLFHDGSQPTSARDERPNATDDHCGSCREYSDAVRSVGTVVNTRESRPKRYILLYLHTTRRTAEQNNTIIIMIIRLFVIRTP